MAAVAHAPCPDPGPRAHFSNAMPPLRRSTRRSREPREGAATSSSSRASPGPGRPRSWRSSCGASLTGLGRCSGAATISRSRALSARSTTLPAAYRPGFAAALEARANPAEIHRLLLAELEQTSSPTVLVVEDAHWADDATLDAHKVMGRRIAALPSLLVLTYRPGVPRPTPSERSAGSTTVD